MRILPVLLTLLLVPFLYSCDRAPDTVGNSLSKHILRGEAMGSYYQITYLGDSLPDLQRSVDSLLDAYNLELSAWVPASKLSAFNAADEGVDLAETSHFIPNLELARQVSDATNGAYDPTIAPLVNYWGFGTAERRESANYHAGDIERLLVLVDIDNIRLEGSFLHKKLPGVMLDLNASAKGYGVDLIAGLLRERGHPNYLIDIGGEMRGGGTKNGKPWNVAIRLPDENRAKIARAGTLPLSEGRALATSGNYLNYYEVDGETFSHTINPATGLVERNSLLSASVTAPDCATADAYATACMVLGPERALELVEADPRLEGYFLVRAPAGELDVLKSSGL